MSASGRSLPVASLRDRRRARKGGHRPWAGMASSFYYVLRRNGDSQNDSSFAYKKGPGRNRFGRRAIMEVLARCEVRL